MLSQESSAKIARWLTHLSPTLNTYRNYYYTYHQLPNLRSPRTLDEKLQWLKLNRYGKDPLVRQCADKWAVREYVAQCGCGNILNTIHGVYDNVDGIDWQQLPRQFVMKLNVGCGYNLICTDKDKLDIPEAKAKLTLWMKESRKYYLQFSEMQYKDVPARILCEAYLDTGDGTLPPDYKLFCFHGQPRYVMLCTKRETGHPEYYFFDRDRQLVRLNKRGLAAPKGFTLQMPGAYDELFTYAGRLAKPFPFVRVDLYIIRSRIVFGELTFTPCGGMDPNIPYEQNLFLGNQINLNK